MASSGIFGGLEAIWNFCMSSAELCTDAEMALRGSRIDVEARVGIEVRNWSRK